MYTCVPRELPEFVESCLPLLPNVKSILGHSMGGGGVLICVLKNPESYRSVFAFSPICNPVECGWGKGCFGAYPGEDTKTWQAYDAAMLIHAGAKMHDILIDQGTGDEFYDEDQLLPENFEAACSNAGQHLRLRMQDDYDHSYHFIASFIGEHIAHHAAALKTGTVSCESK